MQMNARAVGRIFSTKRMIKKKVEGNEKNVQEGLWIFLFFLVIRILFGASDWAFLFS